MCLIIIYSIVIGAVMISDFHNRVLWPEEFTIIVNVTVISITFEKKRDVRKINLKLCL